MLAVCSATYYILCVLVGWGFGIPTAIKAHPAPLGRRRDDVGLVFSSDVDSPQSQLNQRSRPMASPVNILLLPLPSYDELLDQYPGFFDCFVDATEAAQIIASASPAARTLRASSFAAPPGHST